VGGGWRIGSGWTGRGAIVREKERAEKKKEGREKTFVPLCLRSLKSTLEL
jgi:hypothetical protein